ncbi:BamA/TamA family outer membrane protein (plasmid) [Photobacterium sp. GJ3]|uniref:BamA/TamA family outer membrane protein n=1 Tax=Photobacterium sp. GJ3 TaxID=2829502 RepID=UPI001B8B093E|nr:BamA/TamA family outer membrane protein [Photobacterium sp. GJ3]QUJ69625.1 BamA/TamA family outer membrane protein [Photobacterium sp. GJ3]
MQKPALLALAGLCAGFAPSSYAVSMIDPVDHMFDMGEYLAENAYGFLPVPIIITEPALGGGGGIFGVFLHESDAEKEARRKLALNSLDGGARLIPPAITVVGGAATANGTWFGALGHRRTWNQDHIRYLGGVGYGDIVMDIFNDFGGRLPASQALGFETQTQGAGVIQKLQFRVQDTPLLLGMSQFWTRTEVSASNPTVDQLFERILGNSTTSSGLGVIAEYDTRDNIFFPANGYQVSAEYLFFRDGIGSNYNYDTFALDGQIFFPLSKPLTLAFAGDYQSIQTDDQSLPPLVKPYVQLRGISAYRYQDNYVSALQTQLMWHIDTRWTVSGFIGVGSAAGESHDLYEQSETAYGTGFRYLIARRYGLRTGIDFAFSDEENAFYFNVGSGF